MAERNYESFWNRLSSVCVCVREREIERANDSYEIEYSLAKITHSINEIIVIGYVMAYTFKQTNKIISKRPK